MHLKKRIIIHSLIIVIVIQTLLTFWSVKTFEFLNYDDNEFIVENEHIRRGFSVDSLVFAFTDVDSGIWHPLTWLSHTLDCQLYGLNPMGHHWNNLIFHILNVLLVFTILQKMTGTHCRSFFVALLFAVHPVQIESVAWVAERKNVLSTFFYILCIFSYAGYVKDQKNKKYFAVVLFYILGLMSKPMMVTMPFVLLLLDYWPLHRWSFNGSNRNLIKNNSSIIKEKIPLLIIAIIFSIISWISQYLSGSMTDMESIPLYERIELSIVSYVRYLFNLFWPHKLAFFYPYTRDIPLWQVAGSFLILIMITVYSVYCYKRKKYILVGWLWFLITISPVIGFVHLGDQAMADRYMYIPCIGVFIIVLWGENHIISKVVYPKILSTIVCSLMVIVLSLVSIYQLKTWKNNESLYSHAIKVTKDNYIAHSNLGAVLLNSGRTDEAIYHFSKALEIKPDSRKSNFDIGTALAAKKKFDEAKKYYFWVLARYPNDLETIYKLGCVYFDLKEYDKSMDYFSIYLKKYPTHAGAFKYSGDIALKLEKYEEAKKYYLSILEKNPVSPEVLNNLGVIYYNEGNLDKACHFFKLALKYKPDYRDAYLNLRNIQTLRR